MCTANLNIKNLKMIFVFLSFSKLITLFLKSINTFVFIRDGQRNSYTMKSEFQSIF
jgi:hypothetical protein